MNKLIILIIMIIIFLVLFIPIKIKIERNNEYDKNNKRKNDIDIFLFIFIKIRFDLDDFIKRITKYKINNIYDYIKDIKKVLSVYNKNKNYIKKLLEIIPIEKMTIIFQTNNCFVGVFCINIIYYIKYNINSLFKVVSNQYYNVQIDSIYKNDLKFELVLKLRLFYFLYAFIVNVINIINNNIKNIYNTFKKKKFKKGSVVYGKSSN